MTVTIERTGLDYGMIDAAASEWASIRKLVRHAESLYDDLELLYSIPGPEELRRDVRVAAPPSSSRRRRWSSSRRRSDGMLAGF